MTKRNKILAAIGSVIGLTSLALGLFFLGSEVQKTLSGLMVGFGSAVGALSLGSLLRSLLVSKEKLQQESEQNEITIKDERNIRIREKTGAITQRIVFYLNIAAMLVLFLLNVDIWIVFMMLGFLVVQMFLMMGFANYYSKRM